MLGLGLNKTKTDRYVAYTNSTVNGSFENDLTGWTASGTGTKEISTEQVKFGLKSVHFAVSAQTGTALQDISFTNDHIIYVGAWCYLVSGSLTGNSFGIVYDYNGTINQVNISDAGITTVWRYKSVLKTAANGGIRITIGRANAQTAEYYIDGIIAVDLTAKFGAGNEPTAAWCDTHFKFRP
jgi:hypothetical protein